MAEEESDDDNQEEETIHIGDVAEKCLGQFASTSGVVKTFGLWDKNGMFFIGNKDVRLNKKTILLLVVRSMKVIRPMGVNSIKRTR